MTKTAAKKLRKVALSDFRKRERPSTQDSSWRKRTKVNDIQDSPPFAAPFPMLSRHWYGNQAEQVTKDRVPNNSNHVISFPNISKEWRKRSKVNDVQDSPPLTAPFPVLSRCWYGTQAEQVTKDRVPNNANHVIPFPNISKEWYSRIQKSSTNEADDHVDPPVNIIPFPALSKSWYQRRSKLLAKNDSRKEIAKASGSLEQNIDHLEKEVQSNSNPNMRKKCIIVLEVGKYLLKNGPIVQARELGKVYVDKKNELYGGNSTRCPKPTELLATLSPYLNI